jgi:hypothetical protein
MEGHSNAAHLGAAGTRYSGVMISPKLRLSWTSALPGRNSPALEQWIFVPAVAGPDREDSAPDRADSGYLQRGSEQVPLPHCSRLLTDFLRTIRQIEDDFAQRCDFDQTSDCA